MSDILLCVGKNSMRYYNKFRHLSEKGYSFNWCAALFSALWFAYRKMWKEAAVMLAANILVFWLIFTQLFKLEFAGSGVEILYLIMVISVLYMGAIGFLGDWLYAGRIIKILDQHDCGRPDLERDEAWEESVREAGGTSVRNIFLVWLIGFLIQFLINKI